jgi:hypothetical protein
MAEDNGVGEPNRRAAAGTRIDSASFVVQRPRFGEQIARKHLRKPQTTSLHVPLSGAGDKSGDIRLGDFVSAPLAQWHVVAGVGFQNRLVAMGAKPLIAPVG